MPATLLLTPDLSSSLADAVRRGVPIETACQAAGIGERTFYQWLQVAERGEWGPGLAVDETSMVSIRHFSQAIASAQADFEARRVTNIATAAEERNEKTGLRDWRADAWLLNNHPRYRKRYRQEHQLQVDSTVTHRTEQQLASACTTIAELDALEALLPALPDGGGTSSIA